MKTEKEPTLKEKGILDKEVPRVYYKYEDIALALKKLKEEIGDKFMDKPSEEGLLPVECFEIIDEIMGFGNEN